MNFFSWFGKIAELVMSKLYPVKDFTELPYMTPESTSVPFNHAVEAQNLPSTATQLPKTANPTLAQFLRWQWQLEGAVPANNNPGNYKFFYGGYMPIYGNVKRSVGGFAMFPTLAQGKMYALACTKG